MKKLTATLLKISAQRLSAVTLSSMVLLGSSAIANADEADAKRLLKGMSDYLGAQQQLSFDYDSTLGVVTREKQKLELASSGSMSMVRPEKLQMTRAGGFANVEIFFDGKTLTLLGKDANLYSQVEAPGTIEHLIDELHNKYNRPLPAADLMMPNAYDLLMADVTEIKDLGSAVIGGVECDYLAFRTEQVDWQIWIAQGDTPYPCRYVITSRLVPDSPQYSIQTRNWKTGDAVAAGNYSFKNTTDAKKVDLKALRGTGDFPDNFSMGEAQ